MLVIGSGCTAGAGPNLATRHVLHYWIALVLSCWTMSQTRCAYDSFEFYSPDHITA